jgi:ribosomal protein L32
MLRTTEELHHHLDEIAAGLRDAGLVQAAQSLTDLRSTAFTTGSEYLAELRGTVTAIRRGNAVPRALDLELRRLLEPTFAERVTARVLWRGILTGAILAMFGAAVVALVTADEVPRHGAIWIAIAAGLLTTLGVAARRASECPGCGTRIRQMAPTWCPYCGAHLMGSSGPRSFEPVVRRATLVRCPSCGHAPGGRSRYGTPHPSEGRYCTHCGAEAG